MDANRFESILQRAAFLVNCLALGAAIRNFPSMEYAPEPFPFVQDVLDPARAAALHIALDLTGPAPEAGSELLPFFHQLYFWEPKPPGKLGRDGHPRLGDGVPDLGLPRRMWAGGRLRFEAPLLAGKPAEKRSEVVDVTRKTGRSGELGFVTLRHEIFQGGKMCVSEEQDLVYRQEAQPGEARPVAPDAPEDRNATDVQFSPTLLFRYSALTFNGHRIHYDVDYAREVEGYAGLVVHGPLLAQLLMLRAREALGGLRHFAFRGTSALPHTETGTFNSDGSMFWVRGPDGRLCMQAEAG